MTGQFWLDWAAFSLSLTNTILLIWLGTTVLINIEERTWGGWLAAAGLYLGGIFFISHTAILGYGFNVVTIGTTFWWGVGLLAITLLPLLWYVMMLWYGGYWQKGAAKNQVKRRHSPWLIVALLALIGLMAIGLAMQDVNAIEGYPTRGIVESPTFGGTPVILVVFPIYVILCMGLSLDVVGHPGPSERIMGEQARRYAQPWLIGASVALLLVSFSVMGVFFWLYRSVENFQIAASDIVVIGYFDVLIEFLIAIAVILVGQAVVAYEIFTGQSLPRRGFLRQWNFAVLLAVGYGAVIGFVFSTNLRPIYGILLSMLMMTFFLALFSWQTVSERQRSIRQLRPFVTSQGFFDQLLAGDSLASNDDFSAPFRAVCEEVLDTSLAYLVPVGPMAPLAGGPLKYQTGNVDTADQVRDELQSVINMNIEGFSPTEMIHSISSDQLIGIKWVVPLWSQRGLAGVLLLGPKRDGGIYSREEIGVAQSAGERLIDSWASAEIARKLLSVQRKRLSQTQVIDQRARRVLHDDILQDLHATILKMAEGGEDAAPEVGEAIKMLTETHRDISRLLRNLPGTSLPDIGDLGLIGALEVLVADEVSLRFEEVHWDVDAEGEVIEAKLSQLEREVLYYAAREAMRNSARHGRKGDESRELTLKISVSGRNGFEMKIEDDGIGFGERAREQERGGQGLSLHSTMMAVIGGELRVESEPGEYTRVVLVVPGN